MTETTPLPPAHSNPTPKQFFMSEAANIEQHHKLIENPAFQRAIHVAYEHYTRAMCAAPTDAFDRSDTTKADAMKMERIQGANDFMSILLSLAELPKLPTSKRNSDNLDQ